MSKSSPKQSPKQSGRTTEDFSGAEWLALAISLVIVLGALGLLIYDLVWGNSAPPTIAVDPGYQMIREDEGEYYLPVTVTNEGGRTVENVTVHFVLELEDGNESNSLTLRFLAGGEVAEGVVIFSEYPSPLYLRYNSSYLQP